MPDIEVAVAALLPQVMLVLEEAIGAAAADQMLLHLINRMRPGIGRGEREVMIEALLGAYLQSVVSRVADVVAKFDGTEIGVWNDAGRESASVEILLVQVAQNGKVSALGPDILGSQEHLPRQLPLDPEVPLVHLRLHVGGIHSAQADGG